MLRIATIGTSMITDDFIQVVNANDQAVFVGTLSRNAERGAAFTAEHGGERNFTSLDELAAAADVDAVYIAAQTHFTTSRPLPASPAASTSSSRSLLRHRGAGAGSLPRRRGGGRRSLEAMRPLHDPAFHAIEDALGEIAPIRRASLRFGKYSSRYNEVLAGRATNIFDCHMASGSLMDIGVYTVEPWSRSSACLRPYEHGYSARPHHARAHPWPHRWLRFHPRQLRRWPYLRRARALQNYE